MLTKKNYQAGNRNNSVLEKGAGCIKNFFSGFQDTQSMGIIAISAILINLFLAYIMRISIASEWIVYRCIIVISFLPWLFCKKDLRQIARDSKLLKIFRRNENAQDKNTEDYRKA